MILIALIYFSFYTFPHECFHRCSSVSVNKLNICKGVVNNEYDN